MNTSTVEYLSNLIAEKHKKLVFKPGSVLTYCDANCTKEEIVSAISTKLINELNIYYGTILPIYKQLVSEISTIAENDGSAGQSILEYKIKRNEVNQFLVNAVATDKIPDVNEFNINKYNIPALTLGNPYNVEELHKIFTHPVKSLDLVLQEYVGNCTDAQLQEVWDKYLAILGSKVNIEYLDTNSSTVANEVALVYTALVNLFRNKPSWCTVEDEALYARSIKDTLDFLERIVVRYVKAFKQNNQGLLVLNLDRDNKVAVVNAEVYDLFLSEGGKPETVLGLFGVDKTNYTYTMNTLSYIKANTESLNSSWEKLKQLLSVNDKLKQDDFYKTKLQIAIGKVLEENITDAMKEQFEINPEEVKSEITKLLKEKDSVFIRHPFKMASEILGDIVFEKTNFERFTKSLKEYSKLMEINKKDIFKGDTKVLATLVGVDMVIDYVLDQVSIEKI